MPDFILYKVPPSASIALQATSVLLLGKTTHLRCAHRATMVQVQTNRIASNVPKDFTVWVLAILQQNVLPATFHEQGSKNALHAPPDSNVKTQLNTLRSATNKCTLKRGGSTALTAPPVTSAYRTAHKVPPTARVQLPATLDTIL